jgi:hypothetical protein
MITRVLGLAKVLALTLAVSTPALAAKPRTYSPDYEVTKNGVLVEGDVLLGRCSKVLKHDEFYGEEAVKACEAAGNSPPLTDTGGPPIILIPFALLVVGGLLFRKTVAG